MPIVSKKIASATPQKDGSISVQEIHTDDAGVEYEIDYLAPAGFDINKKLAERILNIPKPPSKDEQIAIIEAQISDLNDDLAELKGGK